ncbi:MAG: SPOR domain-containing protein [Sphingopyxis sp.]
MSDRNARRLSMMPALALCLTMAAPIALATPALADVRAGVAAWEAGDYPRAVAEWRPIAIAGDADAQFNLAQAYKLGRGVPQSLPDAATWFRRAADQGHLQSQDNLGLVLYEMGQKGDALPFLEQSSARGEPRAQYVLAAELFNGERMSRDYPRAYALMKRASDAGLQRASAGLVQMDAAIPLEQRQRGLAMAAEMDRSEGQARLAAMTAATPARPARTPTVRPTTVPASLPGVTYVPPAIGTDGSTDRGTIASSTIASGTAGHTPSTTGADIRPAGSMAANGQPPRVAATPPVTIANAAAANGAWRIQLGAFGDRGNAQSLWGQMSARLGGARPIYTAVGTMTRLQAGPYTTRAAAERACAAVRPQPCFAVAR